MTKAVMKLLEDNRKALQSLNATNNNMKTNEGAEEESCQSIVERILAQQKYKDKRARNLDLDDFLELLSEFHDEGIHFTS